MLQHACNYFNISGSSNSSGLQAAQVGTAQYLTSIDPDRLDCTVYHTALKLDLASMMQTT
jgi:hypothetical protein